MRNDISAAAVAMLVLGTGLVVGCVRRSPRYGSAGTHLRHSSKGMVTDTPSGVDAMIGTHTTTEGNTFTVDSTGALTVHLGDTTTVHGTVTGDQDTVTISDDLCKGPGVYVVHGDSSGLDFTAISDACAARRGDLTGDTTRSAGM